MLFSDYLVRRAYVLENIWTDLPPVIQRCVLANEFKCNKVSLFDLYERCVCCKEDSKVHRSIFANNKGLPESTAAYGTLRYVLKAPKYTGKTAFLKSIFCSLVLKPADDHFRWWYIPYGIRQDACPIYLRAKEINTVDGVNFLDSLCLLIYKSIRDITEKEKAQIRNEVEAAITADRLLLLVDDIDTVDEQKFQALCVFLEEHPNCHAILTTNTEMRSLGDYNELIIPTFVAEEEVVKRFAIRISEAVGSSEGEKNYARFFENNAGLLSFSKYYIHTPIDLMFLLLSSGYINTASSNFSEFDPAEVQLRLCDYLEAYLNIRDSNMTHNWDFVDFYSELAYNAAVSKEYADELNNVLLHGSIYEDLPQCNKGLCETEYEPAHQEHIARGQQLGIIDVKTCDKSDDGAYEYVFLNRQIQAYFLAEYYCENPDAEFPKATDMLCGNDLWTDCLACLATKEPRIFERIFKNMLGEMTRQQIDERIQLLFGLLWRIDWNKVELPGQDITNLLLESYFAHCCEYREVDELEYSHWSSGILFYENVVAMLLKDASEIKEAWVDEILSSYDHNHCTKYMSIFEVLLNSPICPTEAKKSVIMKRCRSDRTPRTDIDLFHAMNHSALTEIGELLIDIASTGECDEYSWAGVYGDYLIASLGEGNHILTKMQELILSRNFPCGIKVAMYLIRWFDCYKELVPQIIESVSTVLLESFHSQDAEQYEDFLEKMADKWNCDENRSDICNRLLKKYFDHLSCKNTDYERCAKMIIALGGSEKDFQESTIERLKEQLLSSRDNLVVVARLLVLAGRTDFLLENPAYIVLLRQENKLNKCRTDWWRDILLEVINLLEDLTIDSSIDAEMMEIIMLENNKEYFIANRKKILERDYLLLINENDPSDICVRVVKADAGAEFIQKLDSNEEFSMILNSLLDDLEQQYKEIKDVSSDDIYDIGSEEFLWNTFVGEYEKLMKQEDFEIENGVLKCYHGSSEIVVIPSCVNRIAKGAFTLCKSLKGVIFQEGMKEIGEDAFAECHTLVTVEFVESIARIERNAFSGTDLSIAIVHSPCPVETNIVEDGNNLYLTIGLEMPVGTVLKLRPIINGYTKSPHFTITTSAKISYSSKDSLKIAGI